LVEHHNMTMADLGNDGGVMGPRGDRPKRRVFTAEFKAVILAEYEVAKRQRRQALRGEGLCSSHTLDE
jgi:transposase-like protein